MSLRAIAGRVREARIETKMAKQSPTKSNEIASSDEILIATTKKYDF